MLDKSRYSGQNKTVGKMKSTVFAPTLQNSCSTSPYKYGYIAHFSYYGLFGRLRSCDLKDQ